MRTDAYVFELAVYRVDRGAWERDASLRIEAREKASLTTLLDLGKEPSAHDRSRVKELALHVECPYDWQYNEVIGWIRLMWDGPSPVIKGYLWQVGKKTLQGGASRRRYQRGFIPFPFVYGEPLFKVLEEWFDRGQTDLQIYEQLRTGLIRVVGATGYLPRRHLDLRVFDALAPHVRWRAMLDLEAS